MCMCREKKKKYRRDIYITKSQRFNKDKVMIILTYSELLRDRYLWKTKLLARPLLLPSIDLFLSFHYNRLLTDQQQSRKSDPSRTRYIKTVITETRSFIAFKTAGRNVEALANQKLGSLSVYWNSQIRGLFASPAASLLPFDFLALFCDFPHCTI